MTEELVLRGPEPGGRRPRAAAPGAAATLWRAGAACEQLWFPRLERDLACDVCVVGGGVSGMAVALELAERGRSVVVLEAGELAGGQTSRSSAHLVTALDERYFTMERRYGAEVSRAAAAAHGWAITWVRRAVDRYRLDCGFEQAQGLLVVPAARGREARALLGAEAAAAGRAGVACHLGGLGRPVLRSFGGRALCFPGQAQIDPVRFVAGLAGAVERRGGSVFCGSGVTGVAAGRGGVVVATGRGPRVRAGQVVLATHELPAGVRRVVRPMSPRVSFVIGCDWAGEERFLLWDGYWDGPDPYHYVRVAGGGEGAGGTQLIVGGEDEPGMRPTDAAGAYRRLEGWARRHFEGIGPRRWAWWGRIQEPRGEFALIGAVPGSPRVRVVAGDSGNGMTYAGIAAVRLADELEGFPSPAVHERMFGPGRGAG